MATKIAVVKSEVRPGLKGYWCAERQWLSEKPTRIEVHETENDPLPKSAVRLGQVNFNMLCKDPHLVVTEEGEGTLPIDEVIAADTDSVKLSKLENEVVNLRKEVAELRADLGGSRPNEKVQKQSARV